MSAPRATVRLLVAGLTLSACTGDRRGDSVAAAGSLGAPDDTVAAAGSGRAPSPPASSESAAGPSIWNEGPQLPEPVANNAVVAVRGREGVTVYSFLGIDSTKSWSGVTDAVYRWEVGEDLGGSWERLPPVPGPGRLAPTVQAHAGRVFLIGGYTVGEDGSERSVPNVDVYTPRTATWARAADMPTPVDDAVSGVWASTSLLLVSGWHDGDNVPDVQLFDPTINRWSSATPIPGTPVFGHAGAIVGSEIVYLGGASVVEGRPRFVIDSTAWRGRIDPLEPESVEWTELPRPPGPALYRSAAAVVEGIVVFAGGTDNPYNFDGVGYDGVPAEPVDQVIGSDPARGWLRLPAPPVPTMDHRTLGVAGGMVFLVGGMESGQRVTDRVWVADARALLEAATLR